MFLVTDTVFPCISLGALDVIIRTNCTRALSSWSARHTIHFQLEWGLRKIASCPQSLDAAFEGGGEIQGLCSWSSDFEGGEAEGEAQSRCWTTSERTKESHTGLPFVSLL